jgi:hypothetical protein
MHYYFHLSAAERLVQDDVGEEFATEKHAHAYAAQVASELARNRSGPSVFSHLIVLDETGRVVCNVPVAIGDTG